MELLGKIWSWFLPPPGHDPTVELMYRYRTAFFGCLSFFAALALYSGLLFEWGPAVIRPASAQAVHEQITLAKREISGSIEAVRQQVSAVASANKEQARKSDADRRERIEQQLLWYRQQNCRSKGAARNYTWQKLTELRDSYRDLTSTDWQMPTCGDIGEP